MRPYLEIRLIKDQPQEVNLNHSRGSTAPSSKLNRGVLLLGSKSEDAPLNNRLINFSLEESDGEDLRSARKGKRDIVKFSFLDSVNETPGFLSDNNRFIQVRDIIRVSYGWVLDNGTRISLEIKDETTRELKNEREFRVVKVERSYQSNQDVVNVIAHDRSVDLDIFPMSLFLLSDTQRSATGTTLLRNVLKEIIRPANLTLDIANSNTLTGVEGDNNFQIEIGDRFAMTGETPASYLRYLAEEFGFIYKVENSRLIFSVRTIPEELSGITLDRDSSSFNIDKRDDIFKTPLLNVKTEQALNTEGIKFTLRTEDKRSGEVGINKESIISDARRLNIALSNKVGEIFEPSSTFGASGVLRGRRSQRREVPEKFESNPRIDFTPPENNNDLRSTDAINLSSALSKTVDELLSEPNLLSLFKDQIKSKIAQVSVSLRDKIRNSQDGDIDPSVISKEIQESITQITERLIEQFAMRDVIVTATVMGNPLIRNGTLVNFSGRLPSFLSSNSWYVHTVNHKITPAGYETQLDLLSAAGDNPLLKDKVKEFKREKAKSLKNDGKESSTDRNTSRRRRLTVRTGGDGL